MNNKDQDRDYSKYLYEGGSSDIKREWRIHTMIDDIEGYVTVSSFHLYDYSFQKAAMERESIPYIIDEWVQSDELVFDLKVPSEYLEAARKLSEKTEISARNQYRQLRKNNTYIWEYIEKHDPRMRNLR